MATPHDFYVSVIGKGFNTDGLGYQCVAGFKVWCRQLLGLNYYGESICYGGDPEGYAYRIWYNFDSLGLGKYFDKVAPNQMVDGDWAIWKYGRGNNSCPFSHIAMFRRDNGNGTGVFLGQNQSVNNGKFSQVNISYSGLLGGLRPKIYHQAPTPSPSKRPIYETLGDMYVRWAASYNSAIKLVKDLTPDGKEHATSTSPTAYAIYRRGTKWTCYETKDMGYGLWGRSPSGWICIKGKSGTIYCKEVR